MKKEININKGMPIKWKYDSQLGIVFYCPNCGKKIVYGNICEDCGTLLDTETQIHDESIKIVW